MSRIIGKLIVIVISLVGLVCPVHAQVKVNYSEGESTVKDFCGKGPFTRTTKSVSINNQGPVGYGFWYAYYIDPVFKEKFPGKPFPYIGDATAGTSGLGFSNPWYQGGFLDVILNNKRLGTIVAKEIKVVEQGKRGVVDVIWEPEWSGIKARFVVLPGDDKIYTEITLDPKEEVKSIKLLLVCYPGHWTHYSKKPYDRWISTIKRSIQLTEKTANSLNPKEEPWIFYFDVQANTKGTCAVMYLPEEVEGVTIAKSRHPRTHLTISPEGRKIHLILWSFPDSYKKPEEAYNYLKENGEDLVESLRKFKFEL